MSTQVRWGWSISCSHPGCTEVLQVWGPPPTPPYRQQIIPPLPSSSEVEGWYWCALPKSQGYEYFALCPSHARAGREWEQQLHEWKQARWEVGKQKSSALRRLLERVCVSIHADPARINREAGQAVRKWEKSNPRPLPPWEKP